MTLEQKRAIALAQARLRLGTQQPEPAAAPAVQEAETTAGGVASEVGKGLLRGPSDLAMMMGRGGAAMLGPFAGPLVTRGMEALAAPSRKMVQPTPATPTEQFAGTAAELAGAGVAGGGAGGMAGKIGTGLMSLGGATGEQMGGETGKVVGALSPLGLSAGRWAGRSLADTASTFGAARGHQGSIERLGSRAASQAAGETKQQQLAALLRGTEYAPGVKPTAAEAIAEANMGQPSQFGGATIRLQKDLSGAKGLEDVLPSAVRQQNVALAQHLKDVKTATKPMRDTALAQANAGGVSSTSIQSGIDSVMATPGLRASDVVQKTLGAVKEKISSLADETGRIDARDLYTVRKEIGNTIQRFSKETANWDKRLSGHLERQIQLYIDDAIEAAGGTGWKDYLKTYSGGMQAAEKQITRQREMKMIAAGVKGSGAQAMGEAGLQKPPTMLIREMMLTNWLLKMLRQDPNTPVAKYVAEKMRDPKEYAKLLKSTQAPSGTYNQAIPAGLAAALQQGQ